MLTPFLVARLIRTGRAVTSEAQLSVLVYFCLLGLMLSLALLQLGHDQLAMAIAMGG